MVEKSMRVDERVREVVHDVVEMETSVRMEDGYTVVSCEEFSNREVDILRDALCEVGLEVYPVRKRGWVEKLFVE